MAALQLDRPSGKPPLHLHLGDDVFDLAVPEHALGIEDPSPRGEHDGTHAKDGVSLGACKADLEITGISFGGGNLCFPVKPDQGILVCLIDKGFDLFRSRLVGWIGFRDHVEKAARRRAPVDQVGPEPETGKADGRRKAGRPCADHQGFLLHPDGDVFGIPHVLQQREFHVDLVCRFTCGPFGVLAVYPGASLPQVHRAHRPHIGPLFCEAELHELHFPEGRAGADEDLADPALSDQGMGPGRVTGQAQGFHDRDGIHGGIGIEPLPNGLQIDDLADLTEAVAQKYAYL